MNSKRAFICSLILCGLGFASIAAVVIGGDVFPETLVAVLGIAGGVLLICGGMMMFVHMMLDKRGRNVETSSFAQRVSYRAPQYNDEEFLQWMQLFEPFVRMGAKLTESSDNTFSKFGGLPLVPQNFQWPQRDNSPTPFLLQLDFAEINPDGKLDGFPTKGLLYLFVDSDEINDPTFIDDQEVYVQGRAFQFAFFDSVDSLITPEVPANLAFIYKEFYVSAEIVKTYPDIEDSKEAFDIYCDRPFGGADDGYDELRSTMDEFLLGGWATYVQGSSLENNNLNSDEYVLLLQVASVTDDEKFMWGDCGMLYFYIKKNDLLARKFDNILLDMQCF